VFSTTVHGQDVTSSDTEDPYIDTVGANAFLQNLKLGKPEVKKTGEMN
jgi:hypothetical protein